MRIAVILFTLSLASFVFAQQTDDLIVPIAGAPEILIPAAGDVPGANGTYFRSAISVINLRSTQQRVNLYWMPQGASGAAIAPRVLEIAPSSGIASDSFVSNVMSQTGLGSIRILGVLQDGSPDLNARLHVTARIWTPRPDGGAGTMSQTFPGIVLANEPATLKAIFGLRRDAQYRLNAGISNPTSQNRRFRIRAIVFPASGAPVENQLEVEVPSHSMIQTSIPGTSEGIVQFLISDITAGSPAGTWHAFGSSIDNQSGDAWSQMAVPGTSP